MKNHALLALVAITPAYGATTRHKTSCVDTCQPYTCASEPGQLLL